MSALGVGVGVVRAARGHLVEAELPCARIGDGVRIGTLVGRVESVAGTHARIAPLGDAATVAPGDPVVADGGALRCVLGTPLLGRAIDGCGTPLDGRSAARGLPRAVGGRVPRIAARRDATRACWTGVRAIDGLLTFAHGARIGIFGAPGAGKSTLLDAIVAGAHVDAVVIALVGERGREAERRLAALDPRTTLVCATGDRSAAERIRAAEVAFAQADALRERGLDVLLVLDSLARVAAATRERLLALGEPAGRGGYPPGVFTLLTGLVERAGCFATGSITLVATVLSDGPDEHDPLAEQARAALDGHLVLSLELARSGHFPALDVGRSVSRTFAASAAEAHRAAAATVRAALAALEKTAEARSVGIDVGAADPFLARALAAEPALERFLRQGSAPSKTADTLTALAALADRMR